MLILSCERSMQVRQKSSMHEVLISLIDCARLPSPGCDASFSLAGCDAGLGASGFCGVFVSDFSECHQFIWKVVSFSHDMADPITQRSRYNLVLKT